MKVTNNSKAPQGVHTVGGLQWVPPGESRELAVSAADAAQIAKVPFLRIDGEPVEDNASLALPGIEIPPNEVDQFRLQLSAAGDEIRRRGDLLSQADAEIARLNDLLAQREAEIADLKAVADGADQPDPIPAGPYEVKETTPGWFGIFGANGEQIGKNMRFKDAEAFKALSPEEQAADIAAELASE